MDDAGSVDLGGDYRDLGEEDAKGDVDDKWYEADGEGSGATGDTTESKSSSNSGGPENQRPAAGAVLELELRAKTGSKIAPASPPRPGVFRALSRRSIFGPANR